MHPIERVHLLAHADNLKPLRHLVKKLFNEQGCNEKDLNSVIMAINEACMNVIQHAYNTEDGEIIVDFLINKDDLIVRIYDFSETVDTNVIKSRDLDDVRPGGIGVHLMNEVMDKVEYKTGMDGMGNLLELTKKIISDNNKNLKNEEKKL